jgi:hypothetical protein
MTRKLFLFSLFLQLVGYSYAQQFGGFPPSFRWKQINTDTARIIYTPRARSEAQRIAAILHRMADTANQLGDKLKKINVVLHSNTTLANGYVALAPFRSEYYLVPGSNPFEFGNLSWADQLAVHEYRHVQQYNNFNRGLSKAFGVVLGQEGRALANALTVPDWFFEGDAVYAETVLTPQGRGRMPYFLNGYNSLWKEGRSYSWMKLRNGSLKDYVPNHYPLGYLMANYGYLKYGTEFWEKVTRDASAFNGLIYPFQRAVKKYSGVEYKTFRKEALAFYSHQITKKRTDQRERGTVTNYLFPQVIGQDSLLYLKSSYKQLPGFYLRTTKGEKRIKLRRISSEDWLSYRNGLVAYTSYSTHPRWSLIDYSDIILLDIATGREEKLTSKQKYFTPDLSPDASHLIATYFSDSLKSELHLLSRQGAVIKRITAPEQALFIHPRFINNHTAVVVIRWPNATMSLEQVNLANGNRTSLVSPTKATLGFPFVSGEVIYLVSSLSGNDDLYALQLSDKKLTRLTSGQTGYYFPSVSDSTVTWSAFTSNGYHILQKALADLEQNEVNPMHVGEEVVPYAVADIHSAANVLASPARPFAEKSYSKTTGLFNFHSWRPSYEDPEFTFSLYSDNVMNTFSNELFYRYNQNELSHAVGFNTAYGGLFPVLTGGFEYTYGRHVKRPGNTLTLDQSEARVGFQLPLTFTSGKTLKFLNLGSSIVFNTLLPTGSFKDSANNESTTYLSHFLSWTHQLPRARQQIYPKLGYSTVFQYRHRTDEWGFQGIGSGSVFLPTPFANHSLVLSGSYQETDTNNVVFSNRFANSRGYEDYYFSRMWKLSANYHFPLLYPDWGFANLVYFLRVRSNLFYDFSRVYSNDKTRSLDLRSTGAEVYFDTKWWNQLPVTFGFRYSYLLDHETTGSKKGLFEFIIPLDLIPE